MIKDFFKKIFIKPPPPKHGEINYHLIDRFTIVHFMIGVGYDWIGFSFGIVVLLAIIWEIFENSLKAHFPFIFPHHTADTLRNAVGDFVAVVFGWAVSAYLIE